MVNKRTARNLKKRKELWEDVNENMIWNWKERDGYATIPRTMPYFSKIMDEMSKGKPLSSTYLALWCRMWDESGFIKIDNPSLVAEESGFSGQRALSTWRGRLRILEKMGFIRSKPFMSEEFGYILIHNPYHIVKKLHTDGKYKNEGVFNALREQAERIGAKDLSEENPF